MLLKYYTPMCPYRSAVAELLVGAVNQANFQLRYIGLIGGTSKGISPKCCDATEKSELAVGQFRAHRRGVT